MMPKTLIITRHAHRNKSKGRELDNGLSAKGKRQAKKLAQYFFSRYADEKPELISSPKKRCQETLAPLSKKLKIRMTTHPLLDEEALSAANLERRILRFTQEWKSSRSKLTIINTHGDWIPVFFHSHFGCLIHLKKGGWAEIQDNGKDLEITWVLQAI